MQARWSNHKNLCDPGDPSMNANTHQPTYPNSHEHLFFSQSKRTFLEITEPSRLQKELIKSFLIWLPESDRKLISNHNPHSCMEPQGLTKTSLVSLFLLLNLVPETQPGQILKVLSGNISISTKRHETGPYVGEVQDVEKSFLIFQGQVTTAQEKRDSCLRTANLPPRSNDRGTVLLTQEILSRALDK